jgi:hypothetical protein
MGKLLNLFKSSVPAQRPPQRFVAGQLVDIEIVGEASYQQTIKRLAKKVGDAEFQIILRPEPTNAYDSNVVAVLVDGALVGYLARGMAKVWQPMILAAEAEGYTVAGPARLFGGTRDKPSLGVFGAAPWPGRDRPEDRWGR